MCDMCVCGVRNDHGLDGGYRVLHRRGWAQEGALWVGAWAAAVGVCCVHCCLYDTCTTGSTIVLPVVQFSGLNRQCLRGVFEGPRANWVRLQDPRVNLI